MTVLYLPRKPARSRTNLPLKVPANIASGPWKRESMLRLGPRIGQAAFPADIVRHAVAIQGEYVEVDAHTASGMAWAGGARLGAVGIDGLVEAEKGLTMDGGRVGGRGMGFESEGYG